MFKFRDDIDVEELLFTSIDDNLLLPSGENKNIVKYFQNGDAMTINLQKRELDWSPIDPGEPFPVNLLCIYINGL